MRYDILIGIDPDTSKSGFAIKRDGKLEVQTLSFFALFDVLKAIREGYWGAQVLHDLGKGKELKVLIRIEAGWLNEKSNFHGRPGQSKTVGERIAKNVGANLETGRKIVEMCEYFDLPYELVRPSSSKWTPEYFESITKIKTRNQEKIDAARLII